MTTLQTTNNKCQKVSILITDLTVPPLDYFNYDSDEYDTFFGQKPYDFIDSPVNNDCYLSQVSTGIFNGNNTSSLLDYFDENTNYDQYVKQESILDDSESVYNDGFFKNQVLGEVEKFYSDDRDFVGVDVKKKKRRSHSKPEPLVIDSSRVWMMKNQCRGYEDMEFDLSIKSRLEQPIRLVPDRLYSSIQYQFQLEISGGFVNRGFEFLLSRVFIYDSETNLPVVDGLKGNVECAYSKNNSLNQSVKGKLKAKFIKELSYHNTSKEYYYVIGFFLANNLEDPVFTIESPSFKIYSRKPTKKKTGGKRKRNSDESEGPTTKRQKTSHYDEFKTKLDELMGFQEMLDDNDKKKAKSLLMKFVMNSNCL